MTLAAHPGSKASFTFSPQHGDNIWTIAPGSDGSLAFENLTLRSLPLVGGTCGMQNFNVGIPPRACSYAVRSGNLLLQFLSSLFLGTRCFCAATAITGASGPDALGRCALATLGSECRAM